jgi:single stranded DNA-binding protein
MHRPFCLRRLVSGRLEANPEGTINVPFDDHYAPHPDWTGFEEDHYTQNNTSRKAPTMMAGETTITVIGNLTNDPELRFTPVSREFGKTEGTPVANFTIASTPRTFDAQSKEWKDGETLFLRAAGWREAAENVAESLTKGMRVIVLGRLKSRSYETKEGEKRTVIELEVDEIGPSLRYANAKVNRAQRSNQAGGGNGFKGNGTPAGQSVPQDDPWATPADRQHCRRLGQWPRFRAAVLAQRCSLPESPKLKGIVLGLNCPEGVWTIAPGSGRDVQLGWNHD